MQSVFQHMKSLRHAVLLASALFMTLPAWAAGPALQTAVFAGGCFWGVDAVFKHVKGVTQVESGYAGGDAKTAQYERVSEGDTGHAESVRVRFDPQQISYDQLLQVFFKVAHNPTELNRQGPDIGSQYRSAIFCADGTQRRIAERVRRAVDGSGTWKDPVVTEIVPATRFYPAEEYHQDYLLKHPGGYTCHYLRD